MTVTSQFTKKEKSERRKLQDLAWERELGAELEALEHSLRSWRQGKLDAFDVSDIIHQFHNGRSRKLYSFYSSRSNSFAVPSAIAKGIIQDSEVSAGLLTKLRDSIDHFRQPIAEADDVEGN